jgi:hypothetical protein
MNLENQLNWGKVITERVGTLVPAWVVRHVLLTPQSYSTVASTSFKAKCVENHLHLGQTWLFRC